MKFQPTLFYFVSFFVMKLNVRLEAISSSVMHLNVLSYNIGAPYYTVRGNNCIFAAVSLVPLFVSFLPLSLNYK